SPTGLIRSASIVRRSSTSPCVQGRPRSTAASSCPPSTTTSRAPPPISAPTRPARRRRPTARGPGRPARKPLDERDVQRPRGRAHGPRSGAAVQDTPVVDHRRLGRQPGGVVRLVHLPLLRPLLRQGLLPQG